MHHVIKTYISESRGQEEETNTELDTNKQHH